MKQIKHIPMQVSEYLSLSYSKRIAPIMQENIPNTNRTSCWCLIFNAFINNLFM